MRADIVGGESGGDFSERRGIPGLDLAAVTFVSYLQTEFSLLCSFSLIILYGHLPVPAKGAYISLGLTYCACASASSLCNACLGSTAPGTTGRKRSALLLSAAVAVSLFFQYSLAPSIVNKTGWWKVYSSIPGMGKRVYAAWLDGCDGYADTPDLLRQCVQNTGVYRPTAVAALFYSVMAVASGTRPSLNREAWPAKYGTYFLLVLASVFLYNGPLFDGIFLFVARFGAMAFIIIQQVILIDMAYNWNESWVEKADECDRLDWGSGKPWLRLIVASCAALYGCAFAGIGLLYHFFSGCPENNAVITLTLIGIAAVTAVQLSGTEGSLLTSAVLSTYAVYLAYSTVSKNPSAVCNPQLGNSDPWGIAIGLGLTAISLAWTGFSWTAEGRLNREG